eukprot:4328749-Pyramimonas_sp.AAC.1
MMWFIGTSVLRVLTRYAYHGRCRNYLRWIMMWFIGTSVGFVGYALYSVRSTLGLDTWARHFEEMIITNPVLT